MHVCIYVCMYSRLWFVELFGICLLTKIGHVQVHNFWGLSFGIKGKKVLTVVLLVTS